MNTTKTLAFSILREGGPWLGAARSYLKQHVRGGETCIWSSEERLSLSVRQIEELAAAAVAADRLNRDDCEVA